MSFFVYAIGPENGPVKIGFTNNLKKRLKAIQTGNSEKIEVFYSEQFDSKKDMMEAERILHHTLSHRRLKGEWFDISPEDAKLELIHMKMIN